ncbi:MAG: hypothetical protein OXT65_02795 [Alphaproteobacteria bacterium]|nr:hypothetical protein [Alphaproteobacteria bacterium]
MPTAAQMKKGWHKETHWWTRAPEAKGQRGKGVIHDVTVAQYPDPFPYAHGRNTGFMQPQQKPSKRAQVVIDRVVQKLGQKNLDAFKQGNVRRYMAAQKNKTVRKSLSL